MHCANTTTNASRAPAADAPMETGDRAIKSTSGGRTSAFYVVVGCSRYSCRNCLELTNFPVADGHVKAVCPYVSDIGRGAAAAARLFEMPGSIE